MTRTLLFHPLLLCSLLLPLLVSCQPGPAQPGPQKPPAAAKAPRGPLQVGFYQQSCPKAEQIVRDTLLKHFNTNPPEAAHFIRLFFHDCFVTGCDGSILLDEIPSKEEVEKVSTHNGPAVKGYDIVDEVKTALEAACPGIVSCADILAFANRDALNFSGVPAYDVPAGRRDSLTSLSKNVPPNLPLPNTPVNEIIGMFTRKGMTLEDIVVLIGAHSIGSAQCTSVADRFRNPVKAKDIDRGYVTRMLGLTVCQVPGQLVEFDPYSPNKMDSIFYDELLKKRALLESDGNIENIPEARGMMETFLKDEKVWMQKFVESISRMGQTEVLTGNNGEVRKNCRFVNGGGGGGSMEE